MNTRHVLVAIVMACVLDSRCLPSARAAQSVADGFGADLLSPPVTLAGAQSLSQTTLASGDVNEDGRPDLVGFDDALARMVLFLNTGAGFAPAVPIQMQSGILSYPDPRLVDLDADGHLDLLAVLSKSGTVSARLGDGTGAFGSLLVASGAITNGVLFDVADVDGDGTLDIVLTEGTPFVATGKLLIRRGHGDGSFGPLQVLLSARRPVQVLARDFDGDAITDLLFVDRPDLLTELLVMQRGLGGGAFAPGIATPLAGQFVGALAAADGNGDGALDVYVTLGSPPGVEMLVGKGDGTFAPGLQVPFPQLANGHFDVQDIDRDGVPDLVVSTAVEVLVQRMGRGGPVGAPAPAPGYFAGNGGLLAVDFDGDGLRDIARSGDELQVLTNALGPFIDIGYGSTAAAGTPKLDIAGTPAALQVIHGGVSGVAELTSGMIVFGFDPQYTAFAGGVLVPSPDVSILTVTGVGFVLGWPAGIPVGTAVYAQAVMLDGPGLRQPLASNALVIVAE